jgi:lipopolysaccharide export system protein LptA
MIRPSLGPSFSFYATLMALAIAWPAAAQPPGAPDTDLQPPEKLRPRDDEKPQEKKKRVRINHADIAYGDMARDMWYPYTEEENSKGQIEFQDEDTKLFCDEAIYNENDDTGACAGHVKIIDEETVITGDHVNADFDAEVVVIEANVKVVSTETLEDEKDEEGNPKKRVTTIWCDSIEYTYTEDKADYDLEKEIIVLTHDVTITTDDGDEFKCREATISTVDEWVHLRPLSGFIARDRDEDKRPEEEGQQQEPEPGTGGESKPPEDGNQGGGGSSLTKQPDEPPPDENGGENKGAGNEGG